MKTLLSQQYWDKVTTPILYICTIMALCWMYSTQGPERTLVFDCNNSPDGTCFRVEYDGDNGECFTSSGVELGFCQVRDYLVAGGSVCDSAEDWCPIVYMPAVLKAKARVRAGLVVFSTPVPGGIEKAYCHDTIKGSTCYTLAGSYLGKGDFAQYANPEFRVCQPSYGDDCQLVPAMLDESY